ncbi:hypothetical protein EVAR_62346_1 [Eumeta japonica]|uniref:Uncharacterized protein n=1 Tax=Eumeta variegata TaxID=151549 RepID=A0A4C1ZNU2_EUMVA|nr:hypothetical protein EVAR_62346_1 [Eumeta japonica]
MMDDGQTPGGGAAVGPGVNLRRALGPPPTAARVQRPPRQSGSVLLRKCAVPSLAQAIWTSIYATLAPLRSPDTKPVNIPFIKHLSTHTPRGALLTICPSARMGSASITKSGFETAKHISDIRNDRYRERDEVNGKRDRLLNRGWDRNRNRGE